MRDRNRCERGRKTAAPRSIRSKNRSNRLYTTAVWGLLGKKIPSEASTLTVLPPPTATFEINRIGYTPDCTPSVRELIWSISYDIAFYFPSFCIRPNGIPYLSIQIWSSPDGAPSNLIQFCITSDCVQSRAKQFCIGSDCMQSRANQFCITSDCMQSNLIQFCIISDFVQSGANQFCITSDCVQSGENQFCIGSDCIRSEVNPFCK